MHPLYMFYRARVKWVITQRPIMSSGWPRRPRTAAGYPKARYGSWSTVFTQRSAPMPSSARSSSALFLVTGDPTSRPCTTFGRRSCSPAAAITATPSRSTSEVEGIEPQLFARWLALFDETCRELFDTDIADAFRVKAARIAEKSQARSVLSARPAMAEVRTMTFVVTDNCIKCKYMDCVEVCPVDCFYEGENMLVIHPDECIDCGVCEPECPAKAIFSDTEPGLESWLKLNAEYASIWPNIAVKRDPPADAKEFDGVANKLEQFFSPKSRAGRRRDE